MDKHIVIFGNPFDGMTVYGPFDDHEDAINYGEAQSGSSDWFVVFLNPPDLIESVK